MWELRLRAYLVVYWIVPTFNYDHKMGVTSSSALDIRWEGRPFGRLERPRRKEAAKVVWASNLFLLGKLFFLFLGGYD